MKGSLKTLRIQEHQHNRTKFNDWSDPKSRSLPQRTDISSPRNTKEICDEVEEVSDNTTPVLSRTSLEIDEIVEKILRGQPLLSQKEIRKIRLPLYESLVINLKEDGFLATAELIKDLIHRDEELHKQNIVPSGQGKLLLKDDTNALKSLCKGLMKAEVAKVKGDVSAEARHLLDLAMHFSSTSRDLDWLAEELFEQCVHLELGRSSIADIRLIAVVKHVYASFLLDNIHDLQRAKLYVEESMKLSVGKSWKLEDITGKQKDLLYFESCSLIQKIFLGMAIEWEDSDVDYAVQLCRSSLHWARVMNCKTALSTSLLQLVHINLQSGNTHSVLAHLQQYMKLCTELKDTEGLCEGYILMAKYHELNKKNKYAIKDLQELLKLAEEHGINQMIATAHCKLATFFLMENDEKEMQEHATKAYGYFEELNTDDIDEVRCLIAVAMAQEVIDKYIVMLLESRGLRSSEFNNLMDWKTLRIPFLTNVKFVQPIAEVNLSLKRKMEAKKREEEETASQIRKSELNADKALSLYRFELKRELSKHSIASGSRASRGLLQFQQQILLARRTSMGSSKFVNLSTYN